MDLDNRPLRYGDDILLTGIPRSGTTLVCSLLNQFADFVALIEPLKMDEFTRCRNTDERSNFLLSYFSRTREEILRNRSVAGLDLLTGSNTFSTAGESSRQSTIRGRTLIEITKPLAPRFSLAIKHPNAFTALLPELVANWRCFAFIRNPVSIVASWCSLAHPLSQGYAPMAEAFDPGLSRKLQSIPSVIERQAHLVDWYFGRYSSCLKEEEIFRYEDVISTNGQCLCRIAGSTKGPTEKLHSFNRSPLYDRDRMQTISEHLIRRGGAWTRFYSDEDIAATISSPQNAFQNTVPE